MQQTSLMAYQQARPKVNHNQEIILNLLVDGVPRTNAEIAKELFWSINRVTPRILELRKKGLIIDSGVFVCKVTSNNAHRWRYNIDNTIYIPDSISYGIRGKKEDVKKVMYI